MARYLVMVPVYAEWYGYVEADSEEEAIENFETGYICHMCANGLEVNDDAIWEDARAEEV